MKRIILGALLGTAAIGAATAAAAQTTASDVAVVYTGTDVKISPVQGLDAPAFSAAASDANQFQIAAGRLSLTRSERSDVKDYAKGIISQSEVAQKTLMASLSNDQRKIAKPTSSLSADRASMLRMLEKTPKGSFDNLYLRQSAQVQQSAWASYKGYSQDGTDQPLKQVAGNGVALIEQQLRQGHALLPASLSTD
ncbi:hypothetical protein ACFB49_33330 [Sphingomonas sp. DBB INV C78]|uniref:DUF4142 domain-containing protein n=1 Tax=Sphingomonas sp. DBB INV C78 TaxID=3349434 RepID=UPI0036D41580